MIPIGDDNTLRKSTPVITYLLIALNVIFFIFEVYGGEAFITKWAFNPSRFLNAPAANFITIFTSMFMHAGIGHLTGNMLYLWIFGDNVEDRFGKIPYLLFYLICGVGAVFSQLAFDPASNVPNVGASGAIAGILGAYILLFPYGKVNVLMGRLVEVPAILAIGFWFFVQFLSGLGVNSDTSAEGGVAYMAHIGGFIAGLIIAFFYTRASKYTKS